MAEDERTVRPMDREERTVLPAVQQGQAALLIGGREVPLVARRKRSSRRNLRFSCQLQASRMPHHSDSTSRPLLRRLRLQLSQRTVTE